jgi:hypothetical protein
MKKPTLGHFGKTTSSLLTGSMLMGVALLPSAAKAQGTLGGFNLTAPGTVSEVGGTGSSLSGFPMGSPVTITISGNNADIHLYAQSGTVESDYVDQYANVTIAGNGVSYTLPQYVEFSVLTDGVGPTGQPTDDLAVIISPNAYNGLFFQFPSGTITTTAWSGGASTLLSDGPNATTPGENTFAIGVSMNDVNGAWGGVDATGYSFTDPTAVPEPSTLALGLMAVGGWLVKRRNLLRLGKPGQDIGVSTK